MRRPLWGVSLFLLVALAACGVTSDDDVLTICSSLPLDGGNNARAASMNRAIRMALADADNRVTMAGNTYGLEYVAMDDTSPETNKWDTAQEARNARAAIAEHDCIAYIGTFNSGAAKIAIPILNRVQLPMISPGNTYAGLTKPGGGIGDEPWIYSPLGPDRRNFCRVVPADDLQAPAAVRYAAEELGVRSVYVFHDTELYGKGLADLVVASAPDFGVEVLASEGINSRRLTDPGQSDGYAAEIARQILSRSPDLVYFGGETASGGGRVLRALRQAGYDGYFMGADAIAESAFVADAGAFGDERVYATLVTLPSDRISTEARVWSEEYQNRYREAPDAFAAPSYEAANVVLRAIERAEVPNGSAPLVERARPAVLEQMKATRDFEGILGRWSFDENCDTTLTAISINQVQADRFEYVGVVEAGQ